MANTSAGCLQITPVVGVSTANNRRLGWSEERDIFTRTWCFASRESTANVALVDAAKPGSAPMRPACVILRIAIRPRDFHLVLEC